MFARTTRLLLRPGWSQDAPALFEAIGDERIVRNLASAPWPYSPAHAEAFLATERRPSEPVSLIFLLSGGAPQLIGAVGIGRRCDGAPELGYWIAREHWGRGYATEAAAAFIAALRFSLRLPGLTAGHFLDNPASGRVLEKLGFRPSGRIVLRYSAGRGEEAPCRLFEIDLARAEGPPAAAGAEASNREAASLQPRLHSAPDERTIHAYGHGAGKTDDPHRRPAHRQAPPGPLCGVAEGSRGIAA